MTQLEHGKESRAWLFCVNNLNHKEAEIKEKLYTVAKASSNWHILKQSLNNLIIKNVKTITEVIIASNKIAPENLILKLQNPEQYIDPITTA